MSYIGLLTARYYRLGYEEGFSDGLKSGPEEGYEFGHEVAFQKYFPLGILLGRCAIWRYSLASDSSQSLPLSDAKKARALRQIGLLENMIVNLKRENESEAEHGEFETMKNQILNKSRVVESLMGEEPNRQGHPKGAEEDHIALAKRMDRELQL